MPKSHRWNCKASDLNEGERYCTCCERDLSGHAVRMLEQNSVTREFHDFKDIPEAESQGWFPFGLKCAEKLVKAAAARR